MDNHVHLHIDWTPLVEVLKLFNLKLDKIMANEQQALDSLNAIQAQLQKIGNETAASLQKIIELEQAAQNAGVPQSIMDKIAEVKLQAHLVDDLTPDAEIAPPEG